LSKRNKTQIRVLTFERTLQIESGLGFGRFWQTWS